MSVRVWFAPVVAFAFIFLVLDKFAHPRGDADRLFFVHFAVSFVYAGALALMAGPAMFVRYHGGAAAMEQECDLVVFASVLGVVYFLATKYYEDSLPLEANGYVPYACLLIHAACDSYAGMHLGWDTFFHQVAVALSVLCCVSFAYQFLFWVTHRRSHSPAVLRALRMVEYVLMCAPFVVDVRSWIDDKGEPLRAHTIAYAFVVAAYWQYTCFMQAEAEAFGSALGVALTRPMAASHRMPTYLLTPSSMYYGLALTDGEVSDPPPAKVEVAAEVRAASPPPPPAIIIISAEEEERAAAHPPMLPQEAFMPPSPSSAEHEAKGEDMGGERTPKAEADVTCS